MASSDQSKQPAIDPAEAFGEWDSPFRHSFVAGSEWAPWLETARFPVDDPQTTRAGLSLPRVKAPEPPAPAAGDQDYARYRRDFEQRLDDAYADWKRSVFVSLFEPWIIDRRAAAAARLLGQPAGDAHGARK